MKKIGIVVQRWYQGAAGGAESHAFHYARVLSTKYPVELLTTTAVDADSWESALPPGETKFQGITIR
ncbi:MAG: glycosyltransferase family 1 protein, partial [Spirochaetia bacterium]|nr:glycosyltransferase family 1 protein [Spirochaetia bacterium]